jgi:hypothetical protein
MEEVTGTDRNDVSGETAHAIHSIPVQELPANTPVIGTSTSQDIFVEGIEEPETSEASLVAERPWYILPAIVLSQFAGTALWFAGNAILPDLVEEWDNLDESSLGYLTSSVQFGFILGTLLFALLSVADRYPSTKVFCGCALAGASCNAVLPACQTNESVGGLVVLRLATGFFLAGIYPVGMKVSLLFCRWLQDESVPCIIHLSLPCFNEGGVRLVSSRAWKGPRILGRCFGCREQFSVFAAANSAILASFVVGNEWYCSRGRDCRGVSSTRGTLSQNRGSETRSYDYVWALSK